MERRRGSKIHGAQPQVGEHSQGCDCSSAEPKGGPREPQDEGENDGDEVNREHGQNPDEQIEDDSGILSDRYLDLERRVVSQRWRTTRRAVVTSTIKGALNIGNPLRGPIERGLICQRILNPRNEERVRLGLDRGGVNDYAKATGERHENASCCESVGDRSFRHSVRPVRMARPARVQHAAGYA